MLLATYNSEDFIDDQVKSIFNQIDCKVTLIVSDDNSTDTTLVKLKILQEKYGNIKIIINNTKSRNNFYNLFLMANASQFDLISLSDHDDIFFDNKFKTSFEILKKTNYDGISSAVQCFGQSNQLVKQSCNFKKYDYLFEGAGQGCTFLFKPHILDGLKKFIEINYELVNKFFFHDWLIYIYVRTKNYKWIFHDAPLTYYRIHKNNFIGNKFTFFGAYKRLKKIFNGWYYTQIIIASELALILNQNSPNIKKMNPFKLFTLMLFHGRRGFKDRLLSATLILAYQLKKKFINV